MINGTITSQGEYADKKEKCEIYIYMADSHKLPHTKGNKSLISLTIGKITYQAGVHETQEGVVWISSVLNKIGPKKEKERLIDALATIRLGKGDHIEIKSNNDGIFSIVN